MPVLMHLKSEKFIQKIHLKWLICCSFTNINGEHLSSKRNSQKFLTTWKGKISFYQTLNCIHDVKFVKQTINKKWGGKAVSDLTYKRQKKVVWSWVFIFWFTFIFLDYETKAHVLDFFSNLFSISQKMPSQLRL